MAEQDSITSSQRLLSQRNDLTGQRFGRLLVQGMLWRARQKTRAECLCDCGNTPIVTASQLVTMHTRSCGCLQREEIQTRKRKDITGQRFGSLIVQNVIYTYRQKTKAFCICDCGNSWQGRATNLLTGDTRSCGCRKQALFASKRRSPQHKREVARLVRHRRMARLANLPYDFTPMDLAFMLQYWNYACAVCGREEGFWHVLAMDHFIPISHPLCPGTVPGNIIALCHTRRGASKNVDVVACNTEKHNTDPIVWLTAKLGPRRAAGKLREIETFFALTKERSLTCLAS